MSYTIDDILNDPLIEVVDRQDEMGSYAIKLGSLKTVIFIELGRFRTSQTTKFRLSYVINTPEQAAAYRTSLPFGDDWDYALSQAISGLTMYYRMAVEKGHAPVETWLDPY